MPYLLVERGSEKGMSLEVGKSDRGYLVGRSAQCDLVLTDFLVSRQHFRVEKEGPVFSVLDLQSHNGTYLNGVRISTESLLCDGDIVRAGETLFSFLTDAAAHEGAMAGLKIAGYHLLSRIGVGGMGEVYRARQIALGRTVALKILSPELTSDRTFVERFLSEARAAARFNHPNVIGVHEVGEENGVYYFSMEYVGGGSAQDLISGGRKLAPERATEIVLQTAKALEYAEKIGIVHRDVKPDNLMLTETGELRLADLGIAKTINEKGKAEQNEGVFGSPHYMAPEQARGLPVDHRADLYSLGVTYFRLLTGKVPFSGKDAREVMEKQVFEAPPNLKQLEPNLPLMIYHVLDRLLRKRTAERYPTAAALIADLERAQEQLRNGSKKDTKILESGARRRGGHSSRIRLRPQ